MHHSHTQMDHPTLKIKLKYTTNARKRVEEVLDRETPPDTETSADREKTFLVVESHAEFVRLYDALTELRSLGPVAVPTRSYHSWGRVLSTLDDADEYEYDPECETDTDTDTDTDSDRELVADGSGSGGDDE